MLHHLALSQSDLVMTPCFYGLANSLEESEAKSVSTKIGLLRGLKIAFHSHYCTARLSADLRAGAKPPADTHTRRGYSK